MSSPSAAAVGVRAKAREWHGYLRNHRHRATDDADVRGYLADVEEYGRLLRELGGRDLRGADVLEIGFGTRAARMAILCAAGARAVGVDVEVPLLRPDPATLAAIARANGFERLAKSVARYALFDRAAKRRLRAAIASRYPGARPSYGRLEVCDAADLDLPAESLDLVVSEDVFEHMAPASIERTLAGMRSWLRPRGIALVRPNAFPGISGGHLAEWSVPSVLADPLAPRRSEPWEHLRGRRLRPNTYLNELTLADYRRAFAAAGFEILAERPRHPDLGSVLMTPELRTELAAWPDDELFSNQVLFVLRGG